MFIVERGLTSGELWSNGVLIFVQAIMFDGNLMTHEAAQQVVQRLTASLLKAPGLYTAHTQRPLLSCNGRLDLPVCGGKEGWVVDLVRGCRGPGGGV